MSSDIVNPVLILAVQMGTGNYVIFMFVRKCGRCKTKELATLNLGWKKYFLLLLWIPDFASPSEITVLHMMNSIQQINI